MSWIPPDYTEWRALKAQRDEARAALWYMGLCGFLVGAIAMLVLLEWVFE